MSGLLSKGPVGSNRRARGHGVTTQPLVADPDTNTVYEAAFRTGALHRHGDPQARDAGGADRRHVRCPGDAALTLTAITPGVAGNAITLALVNPGGERLGAGDRRRRDRHLGDAGHRRRWRDNDHGCRARGRHLR